MKKILASARALARFLVGMGYDRENVLSAVRQEFPEADADAAVRDAEQQKAQSDAEVEAQLEREAQAARAAEHDVSKTMHERG